MAAIELNSTTYRLDNLGDVKPVVVIGGSDTSKFIPNLNTSFTFGGTEEFYFNINRTGKLVTSEVSSLTDGKIAQTIGDETEEFYVDAKGRLKWDTVFNKIPSNMSIEYALKYSDGIEFHYQDTLENDWNRYNDDMSLEDYLKYHHRPDEIVGSYAVFCNKSQGKYKTGKIAHITRPFVIDAKGNTEWCSLIIDNGIITVSLPTKFMNDAVYPVRLDPTIGFSGTPGTTGDLPSVARYMGTAIGGGSFQAQSTGICTKMYVYISSIPTSGNTVYVGTYDSDSPRNLIQSGSKNSDFVDDAYNEIDVTDFDITSGNTYYTAVGFGVVSGTIGVGYDSTSGSGCDRETDTATLPSTWATTQDRTYVFGVYLDYTETNLVTYNGNGHTSGTPPVDSTRYLPGDTVTVSSSGGITRTDYLFWNWNTTSTGDGTAYDPEDTFEMGSTGVTLYAHWELQDLIVTVNPSGGADYTSLSAAEAAARADYADLVTHDQTITFNCAGGADSNICVFDGWTTDATHTITVNVSEANRHTATRGTGYRIAGSGSWGAVALTVSDDNVTVNGLSVLNTAGGGIGIQINANTGIVISNCLVYDTESHAIQFGGTGVVRSNIVYGCAGRSIDMRGGDCYIYNNTVLNGVYGFLNSKWSGNLYLTNNYIGGCSSADYYNGAGNVITYATNHSSDGTLTTTTTTVDACDFTADAAGSEDCHIAATSDLIGVGTDLHAATYPFSTDFEEDTIPDGSWQVGADYYYAEAPPSGGRKYNMFSSPVFGTMFGGIN
jgi:hypothetical protein